MWISASSFDKWRGLSTSMVPPSTNVLRFHLRKVELKQEYLWGSVGSFLCILQQGAPLGFGWGSCWGSSVELLVKTKTQPRYPTSAFKRSQNVTLECFLISALTKYILWPVISGRWEILWLMVPHLGWKIMLTSIYEIIDWQDSYFSPFSLILISDCSLL